MQVYAQVFEKEIKINELSHISTAQKPNNRYKKNIKTQNVAKKIQYSIEKIFKTLYL